MHRLLRQPVQCRGQPDLRRLWAKTAKYKLTAAKGITHMNVAVDGDGDDDGGDDGDDDVDNDDVDNDDDDDDDDDGHVG